MNSEFTLHPRCLHLIPHNAYRRTVEIAAQAKRTRAGNEAGGDTPSIATGVQPKSRRKEFVRGREMKPGGMGSISRRSLLQDRFAHDVYLRTGFGFHDQF